MLGARPAGTGNEQMDHCIVARLRGVYQGSESILRADVRIGAVVEQHPHEFGVGLVPRTSAGSDVEGCPAECSAPVRIGAMVEQEARSVEPEHEGGAVQWSVAGPR